ncbi:DUF2059 domain-containing protein [Sagittula sp. SSi028]|uniref:DUF2059 domain-containing protein n=1 Tax=Sagittula sp. SSi028 TaxID=3400636 RepID=UPI003AF421D7
MSDILCTVAASTGGAVLATVLGLGLASPAYADAADDLLERMRVPEMLEIMRDEGIDYGIDLGNDMFMGGDSPRWQARLEQIYDTDKMYEILHQQFAEVIGTRDMSSVEAFFDSETGQKIVQSELDARAAMIDDAVEQAAREVVRAAEVDSGRMAQLERFVAANDLLETNVTGALNASYQFYTGLVEGGGIVMSESDILSDVWSTEDDTRQDTREWLYGFLMMAYEPLSDDTLDDYITFSETDDGRVLNRALFAGFNTMYDEISYALGLAAGLQMQSQEL